MITSTQLLNSQEIDLLRSISGHRWIDISGEGFTDENFSWSAIRVETDKAAIQIALEIEVLDIDGFTDDYPMLHVESAPQKSTNVIKDGKIYFHGKEETVQEIWIVRETIDGSRNGEAEFSNSADIAVVFQLTTMWIAFVRADHFTDAFDIRRASSRDELKLPNSLDEWEENLMNHFELSREWIQVA